MDSRESCQALRARLLEDWRDDRAIPKSAVDALLWFHYHLYADFAKLGWHFRGYSVRASEDDMLMVVRVTVDGLPYVVFVGSLDTTRCIVKFKRQLEEGDVKLCPDRYG